MTNRHTPPSRISKALVVVVKPSGPHQCARCLGSLQARHTRSRGASNSRIVTIASGARSRSTTLFLAATFLLRLFLGLQLAQIVLEPVQPVFPKPAIALQPVVDALQRLGLQF